MRRLLAALLFVSLLACSSGPQGTEILWDRYGVPHIFAADNEGLFYAFGYAQAKSHGDLILRLYGEARGRAAEYWGEEYLDSDRWVRTMGVPALAREWLAAQQPEMRACLEAFTEGINAYATEHADQISDDVAVVLPVTPLDSIAHTLRVIHFTFVASPRTVQYWAGKIEKNGSNTWAVAPSRSASGAALLLINPHLPWGGMMTWYEVQLTSPDIDAYGATLVGQPILAIGFNDYLGWSHTVNTQDGDDLYLLTLKDGGYVYDGAVRPFDTEQVTLKVRGADGALEEQTVTVRRSVHGPVVHLSGGKALALRVAGIHQPHLVRQYWDMARARNLDEFQTAASALQMPMFTTMYADRDGHIMHLFGGRTPVRPKGDWAFWQKPVPGDTSANLWTETHPYAELPKIIDPPSGWLQNANDPPWTTTFPRAIRPEEYPPYMAPRGMSFRAQRSAQLLAADQSITFEEFVAYKHSTRMALADRILDDLLAAVSGSGSPAATRGAKVLAAWDREANAGSRGAILFERFYQEWTSGNPKTFAVPWSPDDPTATPRGLASPEAAVRALATAVEQIEHEHGSADVAWGDVYRLQIAGTDLPASGGPGHLGIFRVLNFDQKSRAAIGGDSFVAAVEFSTPVRARALLSYGNSSQPGSPHRSDQLKLLSENKLREVWRTRKDLEGRIESRDYLQWSRGHHRTSSDSATDPNKP